MAGHVEKRGKTYRVILDIGRDNNGKRIRKVFSGFTTKKEAQAFLAEKEHELNTGIFVEPSNETVESYLLSWLSDKKAQVRPTTFRSYDWLVRNHIIPRIGRIQLSKLKPVHLQNMYTSMQSDGSPLSARSVLHAHLVIHQALDRAVKWGMIPRNPADAVDPPRPKNKEMSVWDEEQVRRFLEAARKDRYYVAFLLAVMTGMRKSEILGLRWKDIDMDKGTISISQTRVYTGKGSAFSEPKTDHGKRSIAIPPMVVEALRQHRRTQLQERLKAGPAYQDTDLVVATSVGTPLTHRNLDRSWYRLLEVAEVPRIRFHDLRHTHATLLLKAGVHPKVVSERLGHANIGITLDTYSHVLPGLQEAAALMLEDVLKNEDRKGENQIK